MKVVCRTPGCGTLIDKGTRTGQCTTCSRESDRARGSRHQRDYGSEHVAERERQIDDAYGQPCHLCGQRMWPHQKLALDHTEDRSGYRGMVHATCNNRDGAQRGNRLR
ncbi:MAG TPA: endonuclease domain-containing protein [Nocardioidaceae bacterium]|nr:endonuclease domain-containing protein [Nocardioidaceae bacterium]